jgi:hypothetical protein
LGISTGRPSSSLKIVVTMKNTSSRNAMSAIDDVGIDCPTLAFR